MSRLQVLRGEIIANHHRHRLVGSNHSANILASNATATATADASACSRLHTLMQKSKGKLLHQSGECDRDDLFIAPSIYEVTADDALMADELFGPILPILCVPNLNAALEHVRGGDKPLALYVFTRDEHAADRVLKSTSAGGVVLNDVMVSDALFTAVTVATDH